MLLFNQLPFHTLQIQEEGLILNSLEVAGVKEMMDQLMSWRPR